MAKITQKKDVNIVWTDDPDYKKPSKTKAVFEMIPSEHILSIRPEKKGRGGKTVSVLYDFPVGSDDYFKKLTKKIKRECGSGGTFKGQSIEIQGDHREKLKLFLEKLGFKVKFTGG
ncbi:MAG: translation initiation factor [Halobacteriovoraceae bacterium]|jgi:translation initiation factor 1|nr:translation initiation factor [Halobacteriovoraceae bacterium]